jgi:hypothetical protein
MRSNQGTTYLSEAPLRLSQDACPNKFKIPGDFMIYPEVGDLQASTIITVKNHDIVINLGTGSQIIFSGQTQYLQIPFYRYWPSINNPLPTISHIPCGRLLASYCDVVNLSFEKLHSYLANLSVDTIRVTVESQDISLLFFPGYCYIKNQYLQDPPATLEQLSKLDPETLLSIWIGQYSRIIKYYCGNKFACGKTKIKVAITGGLGGMSQNFALLLSQILPSEYIVATESFELPEQIQAAFQ